jgi:hypothetical protein
MRKCIDTGLSTFYLKTKDQGSPTNNDATMIWRIGGVCYYDSGTRVASLSGGTEIDVAVAVQHATCSGCEPICYALIDCTSVKAEIHTNDDLSADLGKIVTISGEGSTCWQVVTLSPPCTSVVSVTVVTSYATCGACAPNCCDCQGGEMGCQFDQDNATIDYVRRKCEGSGPSTLTEIKGVAVFSRCKSFPDPTGYVYFRGTCEFKETTGIPDGGCYGKGGTPTYPPQNLEIRFECSTGQWGVKVLELSQGFMVRNGTCDGYDIQGPNGDFETLTVKQNTYCPSI